MMTRILIIVLLLFAFTGARINNESTMSEVEFYNMTEKLSYDSNNFSQFNERGQDKNLTFVPRTINKFADVIMYVGVEGARESMEFGYENPQYNFNFAWRLMFVTMFAFLILPLIQLTIFIGYGIYVLYNWIKKKLDGWYNKNDTKK